DFLLLDIPNRAVAGLRVLLIDREAHGDFQRSRIGHATFFALAHVVLQLQPDWIAALVAEIRSIGVVRAALLAQHFAWMKWIGDDRRAAVLTSGAQMMQPLQVAALAFPVADRVIDELQLRD